MSTLNRGSLARVSAQTKPVCALRNSENPYPAPIHSFGAVRSSHESRLAVLCNHVIRAGAALHSTRRYRTGTQAPLTSSPGRFAFALADKSDFFLGRFQAGHNFPLADHHSTELDEPGSSNEFQCRSAGTSD